MSLGTPRVLLVNDDGPPGAESPYIFGLYQHLTNHLKWNVRVVIPSSQKSWIGKAYHINEVTRGRYFYPRWPDGVEGETSDTPRPLKEQEVAEWILLDSTPATCTNVALHNLYPGEIDLVISGPNFGRNISAAFSLSSGTVGAAMSAALSRTRAIAVSYGNVLRPIPIILHEPAHNLSVRIVEYLWTNWGKDPHGTRDGEVDLYNVNLPMIHKLLDPEGLQVYWTRTWRNSYGRLFKHVPAVQGSQKELPLDNPNSLPGLVSAGSAAQADYLVFKFAPDFQPLINPDLSTVPVGTDGWAFGMGHASVTPMRSGFAEVDFGGTDDQRELKL
ncbi:sure-like protein [Boletus edulis]|uniref:Sure-like protein n=1 Tax=Boletus edulis BED1 TaxID=1328754 RepID=A0AAD4C2S6_BOLED|nr:sure-like protein [Boletus edulis]KAF8445970.1 sure-like protein [Boletus edulis BED1]